MITWILFACGLLFLALGIHLTFRKPSRPVVCRLAGLKWTQEEFCHNFLLTGAIGAGKTVAVTNILHQLFQNVPEWGGLWLDNKGDSHLILLDAATKYGRRDDVIIIEASDEPVYPIHRLNLLTAGELTPNVTASILGDVSQFGDNKSRNSGFFKQQTEIHITEAIKFFHWSRRPMDARAMRAFLGTEAILKISTQDLENTLDPVAKHFFLHWYGAYLGQVGEQRSGVMTSIANALNPLCVPIIARNFASPHPDTCSFSDIDKGKILCVLIPQTYPKERAAINLFFKTLLYYRGARRYDERKKKNAASENLLVLFMDEAQESSSEIDKHFLSNLRDAHCAFVWASQDECSFVPVLGHDLAKTVIGKLRTRIIFRSESPASALHSAELLGKKKKAQFSYNYGSGKQSTTKSTAEDWVLNPNHFRNLPYHRCVILHSNNKFRRRVKLPLLG